MKSIQIIDDKTGKLSKGSIPQVLTDALGVSFDTHIGHDFIDDADERYEFYHRKEKRVPFDLDYFNTITNGGLPTRPSTSPWPEPELGKVYSCVTVQPPISQEAIMSYTSHSKWQKNVLPKE